MDENKKKDIKEKVSLFKEITTDIANSPLRKPLAVASLFWIMIMSTIILIATCLGVQFQPEMYSMFKNFATIFIVPVISYVFSSTYEAKIEKEHEKEIELKKMEYENDEEMKELKNENEELNEIISNGKEGTC